MYLILLKDLTIIMANFNARSKSWWPDDITSPEGTDMDASRTMHELNKLIFDPTHLLPNSLSCIDFSFTDQPNLAVDCGVHPFLDRNWHHQIIYCKFNLTLEYPPLYERLVWDYNHANRNAIAKALDQVDWNFLLFNKNVHKQVSVLNRPLMDIFSNFIPNKLVTFNDKDPPWMTPNLRNKINWKNDIYKDYIKNGKTNYHYLQLQNAISEVSVAISRGKDDYHSRLAQKLSDLSASSKTYCSISKRFFNRKKVPIIPPLLINNKLESYFRIKANYFNSFFA